MRNRYATGVEKPIAYWEPWKLGHKEQITAVYEAFCEGYLLVCDMDQVEAETKKLEARLRPDLNVPELWALQGQALELATATDLADGAWVQCERARQLLERINRRIPLEYHQAEKRPVFQRLFQRRAAHG
ncbi:hypothetical protein [Microbulbifer sp. 2205BS26-8]|uniref:hypothetical protein n=1 Tax=Microbulbifer sp. 2205BS26-8 TaxID=3064386 RepID=UPI00273F6DBA|nr:hypothetical protein [Microbulbifer sp. 2205BS26-8]MDP5209849.1 hypothetical protein [Microbulbifer sp. 2205BS26-8]